MREENQRLYLPEEAVAKLKRGYYTKTAIRAFISFTLIWCFAYGFWTLLCKQLLLIPSFTLFCGAFTGLPLGLIYSINSIFKKKLSDKECIAAIDAENQAGGLLMSEFELKDRGWKNARKAKFYLPKIYINSYEKLGGSILALCFLILTFYMPKMSVEKADKRIELGKKATLLAEQIELLEEEQVIDASEKDKLAETLEEIIEDSDKETPGITFESLDQLSEKLQREATSNMKKRIKDLELLKELENYAKKALEESKYDILTNDILDKMKEALKESGMSEEEIKELGNESISELKQKLEEKVRQGQKENAGMASRMEEKKLITPELAEQLMNEAQKAGAEDKSSNNGQSSQDANGKGKGGQGESQSSFIEVAPYTPMTFGDETKDFNTKYNDQVLPEAEAESVFDTQVTGIGVGSPEIIEQEAQGKASNLKKRINTNQGNGSKPLLPKYRNTVKKYFD